MKILKKNIAWATMTRHESGDISYCTDDCDGVEVWVKERKGQLSYALTFDTSHDDGPYNSLATKLTPQAWAAIVDDCARFFR